MTTPYWLPDAIFYQIFPDRFANGDPDNDPPNAQKWGSHPTIHGFQGGDLRGILQRFDYLLDLGINAIYLNPIFYATSNHRYNTSDFYQIDPRLGTMRDFQDLLNLAHQNNVRIVLDGVFNHVGRGFFAFHDVLENIDHSAYKDWFHIHRFPMDAYGYGDAINFEGWWRHKSLPKLNTNNPAVRQYLLDVARYWIRQGIDGWRLDVPNEINDDTFWEEFRHVVKEENRDACLIGEIWHADPRWANDKHFDGLMNYPVRDALIACWNGRETVVAFAEHVENLLKLYPRENAYSMYVTLGSHDTERLMSILHNDLNRVKLAFLFLFGYPGAPAIYYGDEIGLEGGKDPDCRRAFSWDDTHWRGDLRPWVQLLIRQRKERASLRRGDYLRILADETQHAYAFARVLGEEKTLVVINPSDKAVELSIPVAQLWQNGRTVRGLLDYHPFVVKNHKLTINLPAWGGIWIG